MSDHRKSTPIHGDFCITHLRCVVACTDSEIERALPGLPEADLARLRKLLKGPLKGRLEKMAELLTDNGYAVIEPGPEIVHLENPEDTS